MKGSRRPMQRLRPSPKEFVLRSVLPRWWFDSFRMTLSGGFNKASRRTSSSKVKQSTSKG